MEKNFFRNLATNGGVFFWRNLPIIVCGVTIVILLGVAFFLEKDKTAESRATKQERAMLRHMSSRVIGLLDSVGRRVTPEELPAYTGRQK